MFSILRNYALINKVLLVSMFIITRYYYQNYSDKPEFMACKYANFKG